jgi:hypothetical protein
MRLSTSNFREICQSHLVPSDRHDPAFDRELDQLGVALDAVLLHDAVLVKRDGSRGDAERAVVVREQPPGPGYPAPSSQISEAETAGN